MKSGKPDAKNQRYQCELDLPTQAEPLSELNIIKNCFQRKCYCIGNTTQTRCAVDAGNTARMEFQSTGLWCQEGVDAVQLRRHCRRTLYRCLPHEIYRVGWHGARQGGTY